MWKIICVVFAGMLVPVYLFIRDFSVSWDPTDFSFDSTVSVFVDGGVVSSKQVLDRVTMRFSGCLTLQDGLDAKVEGGTGSAVVTINRYGRSLKEICDTVGRGCSVCEEVK